MMAAAAAVNASVAVQLYLLFRTYAPDRNQAAALGFKQLAVEIPPAQLPGGVEVIGRVFAKIHARCAIATKTDHHAGVRFRVRKLNSLDQRRGLGQQVLASFFLACHELIGEQTW